MSPTTPLANRRNFLVGAFGVLGTPLCSKAAGATDTIDLPPHRSEISHARSLTVARPQHVPHDVGLLLFVQHSINDNVIVFAVKRRPDGTIDPADPVDVFWRRYEEEAQRRDLNLFERLFAFGVRTEVMASGRSSVRLVSFPERVGTFEIRGGRGPRLTIPIGGETAQPVYVYADAVGGRLIPKLRHVDIWATVDGKPGYLRERIHFA